MSIPQDAIKYNEHYYAVYDIGYTWEDAAEHCERMGGHLVTITSADEQYAVETILITGTRNSYWLGARGISGDYRWVTGEEWSYSNWAYRQPDNHSKSGGEGCLMLYNAENPYASCSVGEWNDINNLGTCGSEDFFGIENFGYICEWDNIAIS